jgi:ABC-type uncharacterized transport system permease subunit
MRTTALTPRRLALVGLLVAGWLVGLAIHGSAAAASGWGDIPTPAMLLGVLLCLAAGAVAWAVAPAHRRVRYGVLGGILMWVSFALGNLLVAAVWVDPAHMAESGETWFSLLVESWFWVGLPTALSGLLGAAGWQVAELVGRAPTTPHAG